MRMWHELHSVGLECHVLGHECPVIGHERFEVVRKMESGMVLVLRYFYQSGP